MHYVEAENAADDGAGDDPDISPFTIIAYHFPDLSAPFLLGFSVEIEQLLGRRNAPKMLAAMDWL